MFTYETKRAEKRGHDAAFRGLKQPHCLQATRQNYEAHIIVILFKTINTALFTIDITRLRCTQFDGSVASLVSSIWCVQIWLQNEVNIRAQKITDLITCLDLMYRAKKTY